MTDIGYDLNDDDIEKMVAILDVLDKPNANSQTAIDFLIYLKKNLRSRTADDIEEYYKIYIAKT